MKPILAISAMLFVIPNAVLASSHGCAVNMSVRFVEGAPVDRFVITNESKVAIAQAEVQFDLRPSVGRLIFDTQSGVSGLEVFQPFQSEDTTLDVADGAEGLRMPLNGLAGEASTSFSIDVDDRLIASELGQIRVSGSEMQGAVVTIVVGTDSYGAVFDEKNKAVFGADCADTI